MRATFVPADVFHTMAAMLLDHGNPRGDHYVFILGCGHQILPPVLDHDGLRATVIVSDLVSPIDCYLMTKVEYHDHEGFEPYIL